MRPTASHTLSRNDLNAMIQSLFLPSPTPFVRWLLQLPLKRRRPVYSVRGKVNS